MQAAIEGFAKRFFFLQHDLSHQRFRTQKLGIALAHEIRNRTTNFMEKGLVEAQSCAITDSAAHDTAQNIATSFVGRSEAIGDQKSSGARMISNYAHGNIIITEQSAIFFMA